MYGLNCIQNVTHDISSLELHRVCRFKFTVCLQWCQFQARRSSRVVSNIILLLHAFVVNLDSEMLLAFCIYMLVGMYGTVGSLKTPGIGKEILRRISCRDGGATGAFHLSEIWPPALHTAGTKTAGSTMMSSHLIEVLYFNRSCVRCRFLSFLITLLVVCTCDVRISNIISKIYIWKKGNY